MSSCLVVSVCVINVYARFMLEFRSRFFFSMRFESKTKLKIQTKSCMKATLIFLILFVMPSLLKAQDLQIHYDFRHTVDPKLNQRNFPMISFQYFKQIDTLNTGSFLLKVQAFLDGKKNNNSQVFLQISQSLRFWRPKVYLSLNYSGGLGVAEPSFGYYLQNSFGIGVSYPFQWRGAWISLAGLYRYNAFEKGSHDSQLTLYFGKGLLNYKVFVEGSIVAWTENRNQGNKVTEELKGKKFAFFGDPQVWFTIRKGLAVGSRVTLYYHLLTDKNKIQAYPTIGLRYKF